MENSKNTSLIRNFEDWEQMGNKSSSHLKTMKNELNMKEYLFSIIYFKFI